MRIVSGGLLAMSLAASPAWAGPFSFSTGDPDGRMATASRPDAGGKAEIESADDFVLPTGTRLTGGSFHGLLSGGTVVDVRDVTVEIYRVFPRDSDTTRTPAVPTRVNSPSDVAFASRNGGAGLSFSTTLLSGGFTALNSVQAGGIHAAPGNFTGGNGPVSGDEVLFNLTFTDALTLPEGHYFFVPQVEMASGDFLWLSAPKPIVAPGTPFTPDLQSWIRDAGLDPDWLRVGTDITGGGTFNAAFTLTGAVPEPASAGLLLAGMLGLAARRRR